MSDYRPHSAPILQAPSLPGWKIEVRADRFVLLTPPTGNTFALGVEGLKNVDLTALGDSDFLWISSLAYLPHVLELDQPLIVQRALETYWVELCGEEGRSRIPSSRDHQVAQRLHAMAYLISKDVPSAEARAIFASDIDWALQPENIVPNNHGLMLCLGLLDCLPVIEDSAYQQRVEEFAAGRIPAILDTVLGDDGFCDENSPFYAHLYNIKIREILDKHSKSLSRVGTLSRIEEHAIRSSEALSRITYEDGLLPAIGDSSENSTLYIGKPGTYSSPRTGFWIHKRDDLYVSMRAGANSSIHRHADDLSLIVRYRGVDFVSDSGFHSFDYSNDKVRMLRSQRGHSGLYFPEFDNLINGQLFGRNKISSTVRNESSAGQTRVRAAYTIDQQHTAYRTLEVDQDHIRVADAYYSVSGLNAVQRFILPREVVVAVSGNEIKLTRGEVSLVISVGYACAIEIVSGEVSPPFRGWRSPKPRDLIEGHCLELSPLDAKQNKLPITIKLLS